VQNSPGGERWEIYTVLADSATFAAAAPAVEPLLDDATCCGTPVTAGTTPADCC